jgi:uncharacterized membrane protein YkoI
MRTGMASFIGAALAIVAASSVGAQERYKKDIPDSLMKRATITEAAAAATAQSRVPTGKIVGVELEIEKGKLMYSYDMKTVGKRGIDEVNVDALTGKILGVAHESPATEKQEAAEETRAAKTPAKPTLKKP